MSRTERLAAWLYEHPRLRRAWKVCCALWFGAAWAVATAPTAAAQPYVPTGPSTAGGQFMMAWTGLHDSYGVPVSDYFISTVSPIQAGAYAAEQQPCGLTNPMGCLEGGISGLSAALSNVLASGLLALECSTLIFIGAAGIWFIKFALSAPWLSWLAMLANPFVNSLNVMVGQLYVIPIALLVCIGVGGVIALTKGVGRGLGMIFGGLLVILLIYLLLRQPVHDMLGPNGVLGIGQYLGFMVAEGAVHNGPLAPGGSGASLDALTSLLCDVLLREPIQMMNFNTVVDDIPACGNAWSAAIMTGQISAPAQAMASCGDPGALAYADQLGLGTAGWFLAVIFVEMVVLFALVYIGLHVVGIGLKTFFRVLVLVPAAALAVAPGPTRRFAARSANLVIIDGVEMFATTAGLGVEAIILGEVTSGTVPGLTGMSSPIAKLLMMLVLAVAGAFAYHHMLVSFRVHPSRGPGWRRALHDLGELGRDMQYTDYLAVSATGYSPSGWRRRRMKYPDDLDHPLYRMPKTSDLWPPNADEHRHHIHHDHSGPGRDAHPHTATAGAAKAAAAAGAAVAPEAAVAGKAAAAAGTARHSGRRGGRAGGRGGPGGSGGSGRPGRGSPGPGSGSGSGAGPLPAPLPGPIPGKVDNSGGSLPARPPIPPVVP